ncbi:MAG TPA: hypothetical protein VMT93_06140 [Gemmatimonadaceae bacterium]|nr:hypothetical protein [Gemmatimonadaceae bacterium]
MTPPKATAERFTVAGMRSGAVLAGVSIAVAVEMLALDLLLHPHHAAASWVLIALSAATLAWLFADYRALAERPIVLAEGVLHLAIGRRARAAIPVGEIAAAAVPSWRDIPQYAPDYLKLAGPTDPNVILRFRGPVRIRMVGGIVRRPERLGLRLDDPQGFVRALHAAGVGDGRP